MEDNISGKIIRIFNGRFHSHSLGNVFYLQSLKKIVTHEIYCVLNYTKEKF